jgi:hypothetical protein
MLMLDRYLVAGGRALDLATGAAIRWHLRSGRASPPPLFAVRGRSWLIDFDRRASSRIEVWERPAGARQDDTAETLNAFRAALADARWPPARARSDRALGREMDVYPAIARA